MLRREVSKLQNKNAMAIFAEAKPLACKYPSHGKNAILLFVNIHTEFAKIGLKNGNAEPMCVNADAVIPLQKARC